MDWNVLHLNNGCFRTFKITNVPETLNTEIMKVKIRTKDGIVDATAEVIDGDMVVSPKVERFEPKDGDVVYSVGFYEFVLIYKDNFTAEAYFYAAISVEDGKILLPDGGHIGYVSQFRPATKEELLKSL